MGRNGSIYVVSAPSGAGKHSVISHVLASDANLVYALSATTRKPRDGERDGEEYYFIDKETFQARVASGEFVEWAEVHGNLYGTLRSELERLLGTGKDVILELDVQGMKNMRQANVGAVTVFIMPPSTEELERRLRSRGVDSAEDIAVRLGNADNEMEARSSYDHVIINDDLDDAIAAFRSIIENERNKAKS